MGHATSSDGSSSSSSSSSSSAASLALRIATVALSVASAAMMASASQRSCSGTGTGTCSPATTSHQPLQVSYSDYSSLSYALVANVISAALQAAAAWLTARGKVGESKAARSLSELVDAAAQVLLYSSSALSFSVDDFGTCGRRRVAGVCSSEGSGGGEFCRRVRASGAVSMAAAVALAASSYLKDVDVSAWFEASRVVMKAGGRRRRVVAVAAIATIRISLKLFIAKSCSSGELHHCQR